MDAATQQKDRIGVLEELLGERYSVRAFLPAGGRPQDHRARPHRRAAYRVLVQQPAVAGRDRERRGQGALPQGDLAEAASGAPKASDFPFPREYLGVYLERRRESGFQLYNTLGIIRGDKAAYAKQALEKSDFLGAPHVAIIHTDEPLGIYGAIDCGAYVGNFMLAAQAPGLGTNPQAALARQSALIRKHFDLAAIVAWCAASRSAMRITVTRSIATAPRAQRSPTSSPSSTARLHCPGFLRRHRPRAVRSRGCVPASRASAPWRRRCRFQPVDDVFQHGFGHGRAPVPGNSHPSVRPNMRRSDLKSVPGIQISRKAFNLPRDD